MLQKGIGLVRCLPRLIVILLGIWVLDFTKANAASSVRKVFIVHSYEKNHVCGQPQHDGIVEAIQESDTVAAEYEFFYMDTKRKNNTPELIRAIGAKARQRVEEFKPDVLVTIDDNAFKEVGLAYAGSDLRVVFSGLNGQPEDYNALTPFMRSREAPGKNISGVYEKLHVEAAVRVHQRAFGKDAKIAFFVDTSPTGVAIKKQLEAELGKSVNPAYWSVQEIGSWEQYQAAIEEANKAEDIDAIYPGVLMLRDSAGQTYTAPEIFRWTRSVSLKPEIALNYSFTRLGLFGGAAVDFHAMGKQAGEIVRRVLEGADIGRQPIIDAERFALSFNVRRAQELNIQIPEDILLAADDVVR